MARSALYNINKFGENFSKIPDEAQYVIAQVYGTNLGKGDAKLSIVYIGKWKRTNDFMYEAPCLFEYEKGNNLLLMEGKIIVNDKKHKIKFIPIDCADLEIQYFPQR
ncbi:hypothetical protein [Saccharolobus islandicus]|uniref:Uncharacterized protein n=1 Tax=Saccharolobus islandicus (strain M.16.27) TaxID=427318 RepID=C3N1Z9_SACI3|nr:hypothetical protein [Sulfolobus islandicus]ACP54409.1 hypothetical protein M1627_0394 [Sulfolobus islandicus M.16.27]